MLLFFRFQFLHSPYSLDLYFQHKDSKLTHILLTSLILLSFTHSRTYYSFTHSSFTHFTHFTLSLYSFTHSLNYFIHSLYSFFHSLTPHSLYYFIHSLTPHYLTLLIHSLTTSLHSLTHSLTVVKSKNTEPTFQNSWHAIFLHRGRSGDTHLFTLIN